MTVFVDTSAFYAMLSSTDHHHADAIRIWRTILSADRSLLTSNYVVVESSAILQNILGLTAASILINDILPLFTVVWIDQELHQVAVSALLVAHRRELSLVDCVSFEVCRRKGITDVFVFDQHFIEQGFTPINP
jgi:predicted nucleic acid-binding protein